MATLNLHVTYRPLRIGWCVRDGELTGLLRAIRLTHTLWGGRFNPVIPIGPDRELARALVRLYRVDALYPIDDDAEVARFISEFPHLEWPDFRCELFFKSNDHPEPRILDITHPAMLIRKRALDALERARLQPTLYNWDEHDPLAAVLAATIGEYPDPAEIGLDYRRFVERYIEPNRRQVDREHPIPAEALSTSFTPSRLTRLSLIPDRSPDLWRRGVYFGSTADFGDLVHFWNLRAANLNLLFYDPEHSDRLTAVPALTTQAEEAEKDDDWSRTIVYHSRAVSGEDLGLFGDRITRNAISTNLWNGLNLTPPLMHFEYRSVLASVNREGGRCSVAFSLPEKPVEREGTSRRQLFVANVRPLSDIPEDDYTLRVPNLPGLNEYLARELTFKPVGLRAGVDGAGVVIETWQEDLTLFALRTRPLIQEVFNHCGVHAEPSQAGLIGSRLIQQMGGLQGCRVFKIAGVRDLIANRTPYQSFTRSAALMEIGRIDANTARPDFEPYRGLHLEGSQRGPLQPDHAFTYLIKRGVFRVGLSLKCPNCELESWVALDAARTHVSCELCGFEFQITPQLKDRDWRYRRSGLFGREDHQEGSVPVALTLQQLHTAFQGLSSGWLAYTTAMKLDSAGASIAGCETDFVIVLQEHDGTVILLIGECKTAGEISEEDVANLSKVADATSDHNLQTFIVFSKLTSFTAAEIERCQKAQAKYSRRVILLTHRELEPYNLYERTEKEFVINGHALKAGDLAQVTWDVFFEPKPRAAPGGEPEEPRLGDGPESAGAGGT